jgi:pSer/pThr/pTyr-binding forkhead associated (FHA) protein
MTDDRTAMLFCPPLPPLRLGPQQPLYIGRHPSCDLSLRKDDVSRKHAEVRFEAGLYVIGDLRSTNGTFLNGRRIEGPQPLAPGDRIEIGSSVITFCEIECTAAPDFGDGDEARTVIFERPEELTTPAFGGDLSEVPTSALFQLRELGSNTGVLEVSGVDGAARVWFEMGRPIHAETEKRLGFDAAIDVVSMTEGQFRFGPQDAAVDSTINASVTELLLEACRQQDEAEAGL